MKKIAQQCFSSPIALFSILLVALLPTFLCLLYFFQERTHLEMLEGRLSALKAHVAFVERAKAQEKQRLQNLQQGDPAYLEKQLESMVLLEGEIKRLQALPSERNAERLRFLKEGRNSLRFIEQNFRKKPPYQEADVRLEHSVEMDAEDLRRLLSRIEATPAPELIIKQFELSKKTASPQEEVYHINFELIKRELSHE